MSVKENTKKGKFGEELALQFFADLGFEILVRNYRFKRAEVDMICKKGDLIVFIEVKYRNSLVYGHPEESVTEKKIELIKSAADQYVFENDWQKNIRFDVLSILNQGGKREYLHLEDAF